MTNRTPSIILSPGGWDTGFNAPRFNLKDTDMLIVQAKELLKTLGLFRQELVDTGHADEVFPSNPPPRP